MSYFNDIPGLQIVLLAMLAFATLAFTLLAMVTVSNAWRLRNPLLTWHAGKLNGYPLFSSLFLVFTIAASVVLIANNRSETTIIMMCYSWISLMWLFSSYQMSKRYITDNGIVKNVNDPSQTVAWGNISDYIEQSGKAGTNFVFFYMHPADQFTDKYITRLELFVPINRTESFRKLLNYKLKQRFAKQAYIHAGYEQLN